MISFEVISLSLVISALWGILPVVHKFLLDGISGSTLMILGSVFYTSCIAVYAVVERKTLVPQVSVMSWTTLAIIATLSITTGFFANLIYYHVLKHGSSSVVSALIYSSPVFTVILAYFWLRERLSLAGYLGVAFIVAGVVLLAFNDTNETFNDIMVHR